MKKIITYCLAAALALSMAACTSEEAPSEADAGISVSEPASQSAIDNPVTDDESEADAPVDADSSVDETVSGEESEDAADASSDAQADESSAAETDESSAELTEESEEVESSTESKA
jgi:Flp pilus assembly protein TadD